MDSKIELVRLLVGATPIVDYSYEFYDYSTTESTDFKRLKDPAMIRMDPKDSGDFYWIGRYQGNGAIMRFTKRTARLRWWARFDAMSSIRGFVQVPNDSHFYICGDYNVNGEAGDFSLATYTAGIARIINDGTVKWYMTLAGTNPDSATGAVNQDRCYGLTIDPKTSIVTALMQVKAKELRNDNYFPGDFYDTMLLQFDSSGTIERSVTITNYDLEYDMFSA